MLFQAAPLMLSALSSPQILTPISLMEGEVSVVLNHGPADGDPREDYQ